MFVRLDVLPRMTLDTEKGNGNTNSAPEREVATVEDDAIEHAMDPSTLQSQLDQPRVKQGQSHDVSATGLSEVSESKSALVTGAAVEVWSNTDSAWCIGKVLSMAE